MTRQRKGRTLKVMTRRGTPKGPPGEEAKGRGGFSRKLAGKVLGKGKGKPSRPDAKKSPGRDEGPAKRGDYGAKRRLAAKAERGAERGPGKPPLTPSAVEGGVDRLTPNGRRGESSGSTRKASDKKRRGSTAARAPSLGWGVDKPKETARERRLRREASVPPTDTGDEEFPSWFTDDGEKSTSSWEDEFADADEEEIDEDADDDDTEGEDEFASDEESVADDADDSGPIAPPRSREPRPSAKTRPPLPPKAPAKPAAPKGRGPVVPLHVVTPTAGKMLWTCRDGFEPYLYEELKLSKANPKILGPALVESDVDMKLSPAFARMGFRIARVFEGDLASQAKTITRLLLESARHEPLALQVWTADSVSGNALTSDVEALEAALRNAIKQRNADVSGGGELWAERAREVGGWLGQVCVVSTSAAAIGVVKARDALSIAPGGRRRMKRDGSAPSRAGMKLEEALDGLGIEPGSGEQCVDLGAAPGGWTQRLVSRGARVIAVDPARLMPELADHKRVRHVQESAFDYSPEEPVDWLFCDMAWRPLEVAQLLAKWGRHRWATTMVANIKLPMKEKVPILQRVRRILEEDGGWKDVKMRQLYHDRDEVTVTARFR